MACITTSHAIVERYESEDTSTRISRITVEKLYDEWLEYKKMPSHDFVFAKV